MTSSGAAIMDGVGAVGAKLLYPDGRIQHLGVVMGHEALTGHYFQGEKDAADDMDASSANPDRRSRTRRAGCPEGGAVGCPFFWFLFFGHAKKRNRPAGMRDEPTGM